jgi:GTP-binding protein EngB required for normal cell division
MGIDLTRRLEVIADIVRGFGLATLGPPLHACQHLDAADSPLDVALLGQFKSGKSSLLNAILGEPLFPVGAVPVTAVITRASAGPGRVVCVRYLDGAVEEVGLDRLADFVTEAANPGNRRQVAVVDAFTPTMAAWPGVRLVNTPGLGSIHVHNTEATRRWMPNVAMALVAVSAERPLSDEDRRLVEEARQTAPRVLVVLTKVDLLGDWEQEEVAAYLDRTLRETFGTPVPVLRFSTRSRAGRWAGEFREAVLAPVAADVAGERRAALALKLEALLRSCREYLTLGQAAAERADADRDRLRAAVLDETVKAAVIRDELQLAEQRVRALTRPAFEELLFPQKGAMVRRIHDALAAELEGWGGNLAEQTRRYEAWIAGRLLAELTPVSSHAAPRAAALLGQAEERLRRVVEAFRGRLGRNVAAATGITISPVSWEVNRPAVGVVPVAVGRTFMTHWDLLWWLLPMRLVGWLFRRHVLGRVPWEVEKNLHRLAGDWAEAVDKAVAELQGQAVAWVDADLATLKGLLGERPAEAGAFRDALDRLEAVAGTGSARVE